MGCHVHATATFIAGLHFTTGGEHSGPDAARQGPSYSILTAQLTDPDVYRGRDHGDETIVGLVMLFALEHQLGSPRAQTYRPVIQRMLDRVLASANADGLLYTK